MNYVALLYMNKVKPLQKRPSDARNDLNPKDGRARGAIATYGGDIRDIRDNGQNGDNEVTSAYT